ncbi:MAG: hypothetical protein ACOH2N_04065 [Devosia sp.]
MTIEEFEDGLDQYGSDLADWPEDRAALAHDLLARSEQARQSFALAKSLDDGLDNLLKTPIAAPRGLADRIVASASPPTHTAAVLQFSPPDALPVTAAAPPRSRSFWQPQRFSMIAAAMLVVCFIGGVITARTVSPTTASTESVYISAIYGDLAR